MSSQEGNQPTCKAAILQIDSATFQVAVTEAMTAVMAQLNANNATGDGGGAGNTNCSNNQEHQRVSTNEDALDHKTKSKK